ncbi:coadhesin-like [Mizuhopecten yessoensis]|uniref:coadhesin-like n=1 Tax=Mizuhopecten yessoensis TaxID=6573 RepID=UPI000B45C90A|nr:coadhesin-like [Mizuhopecten yessoensis]
MADVAEVQKVVETLCLTFAYHMYGSSMGTLNVLVSDDLDRKTNVWTRSGNQGNEWHGTGIQIPPEPSTTTSIKIFFEGIRGSSFEGDAAIDNVVITPVNGMWGSWSTWSICSVTCAVGSKSRTRQCNDPAPAFNGHQCTGEPVDKDTCTLSPCPVNGMWGSWSTWNTCSVTCAVGSKSRTRQCNDPTPAFNGLQCTGEPVDKDTCTLSPCPVNGMWGSWSAWNTCSVTCAVGSKSRTRQCNDPAPALNGLQCTGEPVDKDACTLSPCPVDGGWASWRTWSACSDVNNEVVRAKCRKCINPSPQYGGDFCSGNQLLVEQCPTTPGYLKRKCRCRRSRMPVIKNISVGELADIMDKTKEELTVDKTQTAVAISKKISAPDSRKSSFAMGILGIIMFAVPVAFLIGIDLMNVYQYFKGRNQ